jgi:hypothetical protein
MFMKMKTFRYALLLLAMSAFCTTVKGQDVKEVIDSVKAGVKAGSVKEAVAVVKGAFEEKVATAETIIGTWTYKEPAVLVTSGRIIVKAIGNASAGKLEKLLTNYFEKANITPENTYFTFRKDGTFERCVAGHKAEGHWMLGDKLLLGIHNVQTGEATHHLEDGELTLVVAAGKIMSAMVSLGAIHDTATNNAIVKLSKKLKGIEGGFTLVKKQ